MPSYTRATLGMPSYLQLTVDVPDAVEGAVLEDMREPFATDPGSGEVTARAGGVAAAHLDFLTGGTSTFSWLKPLYPGQSTYMDVHLDIPPGNWARVRQEGFGRHVEWRAIAGGDLDGVSGYLRMSEPVLLVDVHHLTVMLDAAALCADADADHRWAGRWSAEFPEPRLAARTQEWRFGVRSADLGHEMGVKRINVEIFDVEGKVVARSEQYWVPWGSSSRRPRYIGSTSAPD